jgi:hypothetical protein
MKRAVFLVVLALLTSRPLFAQSTTEGAVGGLVVDQSKGVLPGATVNARNVATNSTASTTTDESGHFTVIRLQPGTYSVEVTLTGFATQTRNVVVEVGRVTNLDITLGVAGQTETVSVVAETPVINRETSDLSTNINQTSLNNLPVSARRWSNFVLSTPGAAPDGTFGLISFRGISGLLNNNTVDGGDNTQAFFAEERGRTRLSYSLSLAAVQEFQVTTSNYSAEYGRSAGGVVNAVTKSGSNTVSGEGFYFDRDNTWGASNPFTTIAQKQSDGSFAISRIKPDDKRQQYGVGVGGPIRKDKLFFFFNADRQTRDFPLTSVPGNPTAFFAPLSAAELATLAGRGVSATQANDGFSLLQSLTGVVARTGTQNIVFPKVDWQINSKNSLAVSYNHLRWNSPAGVQTGASVSTGIDNIGNDVVEEDWVIGRLNSVISPRFTNEIRYQWGYELNAQTSQDPVAGEPVAAGTNRSPNVGISGTAAFSFGKPTFLDRRAFPDERRIQVSDTATWLLNTHLVKFGIDINHVHDLNDNLFTEGGSYSYNSRVDFISDFILTTKLNQVARNYSTFNQGIGPTSFVFNTVDYSGFVQDSWHVSPRVTLNLGLRYEYQQMPDPQTPNPLEPRTSVFPSDKNNWGPRVGVNWDASGNGNTVVRGGYGVFYGRIINSTISNAIANTGVANSQLSLLFSPTTANAPVYPNILPSVSGRPATPPNIVFFEPDTQNPTIHQYDVIFDQKIAANTVVSVSYVGSKGRHLPVFLDQNLNPSASTLTYSVIDGPLQGQSQTVPFFSGTRPNPNFTVMTQVSYDVESTYNALILALNRRLTKGLQVQTSYTFSRSTDNGQSSTTFTSSNNVLNPFDLSLEQGLSNFDVPHRFSFSAVWQPHVDNIWLNNFTFAPIITATSGGTFTPAISGNAPPTTRINTGILGVGGSNRLPSIERNSFRLPNQANVDFRIARAFPLSGRMRLEVLAEAFNLFNRINYTSLNTTYYTIGGTAAAPTLTYNAATFSLPTNANNGTFAPRPREIQLGARFTF